MLILGESWIEFCEECGLANTVTNKDTGEIISIAALFERLSKAPEPELPDMPICPDCGVAH